MTGPVLRVENLRKTYGGGLMAGAQPLHAVNGVSFDISRGETLALVGESGCGKSSIGRMVLRLQPATGGRIELDGTDITALNERALAPHRRKMQMVFQDPFGSLNPRKRISHILGQPFRVAGAARPPRDEALALLDMVGMKPAERFIDRLPHEFSGGQRQRIAIARAFALRPKLVVADEPVSALDVSVRAQILRLFRQLQVETGAAFLFISHDLGVVRAIAHRVAVMYLGRLVETGPVEAIFTRPAHPYTRALLSASPLPDPLASRSRTRVLLQGDPPSPRSPPAGCCFHTRCPSARELCRTMAPAQVAVEADHVASCHYTDSNVSLPQEVANA